MASAILQAPQKIAKYQLVLEMMLVRFQQLYASKTERQRKRNGLVLIAILVQLVIIFFRLYFLTSLSDAYDLSVVPTAQIPLSKPILFVNVSNSSTITIKSVTRNSTTITPRIRFLLGIMSTNREDDRKLREAIRASYLSYYKDDKENSNRICSLSDLQSGRILRQDCQFAYTFVIGAFQKWGPMDLTASGTNHTAPLTVDRSPGFPVEKDATYLNIRENMNDGKMQTWFKYAATFGNEFDYIVKVDGDTILFPPRFAAFAQQSLNAYPYNRLVYGGIPNDMTACGIRRPMCQRLEGTIYMGGQLYFMSPDLAHLITSPGFNRRGSKVRAEGVTIGNLVFRSPHPVKYVIITPSHLLWEHGRHIKDHTKYRRRWIRLKDNCHAWNDTATEESMFGLSLSYS